VFIQFLRSLIEQLQETSGVDTIGSVQQRY
jgi:hypothetical protein